MVLVLTNDDGIDAPGIWALLNAVEGKGMIVAPQQPLSGCSHQVTSHRPIAVEQRAENAYAIAGTPADCTRLALRHLCHGAEVVLSGINTGGNLGTDIYHSGTVAAVREAALLRVPGIAISHFIRRGMAIDWAIATRLTQRVLKTLLSLPQEEGTFWNVNLPHLAPTDPEPELVFCSLCTQPLPTDYQRVEEGFVYVGQYPQRARDPGADVDVCFSGQIAVTKIRLWGL